MSKEKLAEARHLIQQKRYDEARKILRTLKDDETARKWLAKLDEITPARRRTSPLLYGLGLMATLGIGIIIGIVVLKGQAAGDGTSVSVGNIPTAFVLPSATFTETSTLTSTPTNTPALTATLTFTPSLTNTALPTRTPFPTLTPRPTNTPVPTNTLTATVPPQTSQIGPIYDSLYDETFSVEITLQSVEFTRGEGFERADPGNIYVIAQVVVHNIGPGALRSISNFSFQIKDANGAIRNPTFIIFRTCNFDMVDLTANGSVTGCVVFKVPDSGGLELIYAPFQYEGLVPGRYVSFTIR